MQAAQKGCDFWNNLSGTFKADGREVNFGLEVVQCVDDGMKDHTGRAATIDKEGDGNTFRIVFDSDSKLGENVNGNTNDGRVIQVKESRSNTDTPAHEIGHSLGLIHSSSGLMQPYSSTRTNNKVNKSSIKTMINNTVKVKVNIESMEKAGKGHVQEGNIDKVRKIEEIKRL